MALRRRLPPPSPPPSDDFDELPEIPEPAAIPSDTAEQRQKRLAQQEARDWPSVAEVSIQTGIPETTLRRWCAQGKLEAVTVDRAYRIDPAAAVRLAVQEERLHVVATGEGPAAGLATATPAYLAAPRPETPPAPDTRAPVALMSAVADLMSSTNARLRSDQQHTESLVTMVLGLVPKTSAAFVSQIDGLLRSNQALQDECEKLRTQVREMFAAQKDGLLEEKQAEIKKKAVEGGIDLAKSLAPQVLAMVAAKYAPGDFSACDQGVAALLKGISEEQAIKLHASGLVTEAQSMEALSFRAGTPAPGALTRWMQSFTSEQVGRILAADVLTKDQKAVFAASHEAASKTVAPAPVAAAPAPAAPAAGAPPAGAVRVPSTWRILSVEEVDTVRALIAAMLEVDGEELTRSSGEKTSVLELIGAKMQPAQRARLKSIEWSRTQVEGGS